LTNAQDLSNPLGEIHRVFDERRFQKDNPFRPQLMRPSDLVMRSSQPLFVVGIRSRSALGIGHGPTGGDEINIIEGQTMGGA
jgi:hypothetical protein